MTKTGTVGTYWSQWLSMEWIPNKGVFSTAYSAFTMFITNIITMTDHTPLGRPSTTPSGSCLARLTEITTYPTST